MATLAVDAMVVEAAGPFATKSDWLTDGLCRSFKAADSPPLGEAAVQQ